jgi:toxin ParE1/3/4
VILRRSRALLDLAGIILDLSRRAGPEVAERFCAAVESALHTLESAPAIGRPRRFRQPGLRSWQVPGFRRWLLFYRPLDQDRGVELVRVVHGARDLRRILGNPW